MKIKNVYKPLFRWKDAKRITLITGGRGSAKSFHVGAFNVNATYMPHVVSLYTRFTMTSAEKSIIPEVKKKIELMGKADDFSYSGGIFTNNHTESRIMFSGIKTSSGDQTANLKSLTDVNIWTLEEAEEERDKERFKTIARSVRSKMAPNRIIVVMNPCDMEHFIYKDYIGQTSKFITVEGIDIPISDHPLVEHIHTTYLDNLDNLPQDYLDEIALDKSTNSLLYRHVWLGEWVKDMEGLLWNQQLIDRCRISKNEQPEYTRVVVAIDPAITANEKSDETGIVVCAKDSNGNGYVLEDLSGVYSPNEWGTVASQAVRRWNADCIVAEKNQGGDMVENVIRQHDRHTRVKLVTATKGKAVRAEPVYSLYQQLKVYHVGNHPLLERQMVTFNPNVKSPDRVDALVWGLTDLVVQGKRALIFV